MYYQPNIDYYIKMMRDRKKHRCQEIYRQQKCDIKRENKGKRYKQIVREKKKERNKELDRE